MSQELAIIESIKADLVRRGEDLSGSCGAFKITHRAAIALRLKLLKKTAGTRACPRPDGSCANMDEARANELGYADGYLIKLPEGFGFDILKDAGGANGPQWPEHPEMDPDLVRRNLRNWADPPDLLDAPDEPEPEPIPDQSTTAALAQLRKEFEEHRASALVNLARAFGRIEALETEVTGLKNRRLPPLVAEGNTSRVWGHGHPAKLAVREKTALELATERT